MEMKQMLPKNQRAGHEDDQKSKVTAPPPPPPPVGKVSAARAAVKQFLESELGARETRITKIAPVEHGALGWSAEAEILVPNLEIKTLGLPLTQEILEQEYYLVELDIDLIVRSYEYLSPSSH
ncbi:conserved hypothetical protein [Methylocella tundrae]|nr:conserved hypothetical protein [Methylocella tundrae]